jgi:hypothetical protein
MSLCFRKKLQLPRPTTNCHITGYPRSANTYSHYLAHGLFPGLEFVTHVHTIASLKAAKKYGVPVMVILRHPQDTVASMCLKRKKDLGDSQAIDDFLSDYTHYHLWLQRKLPNCKYCLFEDITTNPVRFCEALADVLQVDLSVSELPQKIESIKADFAKRESLKDPDGSSLPQETRRLKKAEYLDKVRNSSQFSTACSVYEELSERAR